MAKMIGKAEIRTLGSAALAIADLSGYITPKLDSVKIEHDGTAQGSMNQGGQTATRYYVEDGISCTFEFTPTASTGTNDVAGARKSAGLPPVGSAVVITGLPVIVIGGFDDGLNTACTTPAANVPWIYEGGGSINGQIDGAWTATLPLKRYVAITSATAIT